jgi:hypothetical protein
MNITGLTFENLMYPTPPSTNYILGNVGDLVRVTIDFSSNSTFDAANYYSGINTNSTSLYPFGGTEIPEGNFANLQTNAIQKYIIDGVSSGVYSVTGDKSHDTTESIILNNVAGNNYELIHTFRIPYYLAESTNPTWSTTGDSLKYFFRLELRPSVLDTNIVDDTNSIDLTSTILDGNVGAWGERFAGNSPFYTLSFFDDLTTINYNEDYNGQFVIQNNHPTNVFDASTRLYFYVVDRPSTYNGDLSLNDNVQFEALSLTAGGSTTGTRASVVSATIDSTTQITVDYTLAAGAFDGDASIWMAVSTDDGTSPEMNNLQPVPFTVDATYLGNEPVLKFGSFKFMPWWLTNELQANDCFNGFKGDDGRVLFKITNPDSVVTITQFEVGIRNINSISRNRQRPDSNYKNVIEVTKIGTDYSFAYGFEVWDEFINGEYELFVRASYDNDGTAQFDEWSTGAFGTADEGTTQNTAAEPIVELSTVEFYEVDATGTPVTGALPEPNVGVDNLVKFYWNESNLGDLQATIDQLVGYLAVCPKSQKSVKEVWRFIFSEYGNELGTPWKEAQGHTPNRALVTKIDATNASVEAILTWEGYGYNRLFGYEDPCFLGRLDRKCDPANTGVIAVDGFHFRDSGDTGGEVSGDPITGASCGTDLSFKGSGSEPLTLGEWEIPNGEAIHFYVNPFAVPDWFFIEQITNFGDALGTGTKIASTGRDASGNYNDPAVGIFDASTFPSNNGFIGSWGTFTLPIPDRTNEMFADTGFDASSYMQNAYDQVLWYKNTTGSSIKIALRVVPNEDSNTVFEAKRICP